MLLALRVGIPKPPPLLAPREGTDPRGKSAWSGMNEGGGDWCGWEETGKNGW